jgi:hypothetical protein
MTSLSPNTAAIRTRRVRRRVALGLLGWAMTASTVGLVANYASEALFDRGGIERAAADAAHRDSLRHTMAAGLADSIAAVTGSALSPADIDQIASNLDPDAVAAALVGLHLSATVPDAAVESWRWDDLVPGIAPARFGVDGDVDVVFSPQVAYLGDAAAAVRWARIGALAAAAVLAGLAFAVAVNRSRVLIVFGRRVVFICAAGAAASHLAPRLLIRSSSTTAQLVSVMFEASTASMTPLLAGLAILGAVSWDTGRRMRTKARMAAAQAISDAADHELREFAHGSATPSSATAAPVPARPYWELAEHHRTQEPFAVSEVTEELDADEQRRLAHATARAWSDPRRADADDAELLSALLADRVTFHQVVRFWERFDGRPHACAQVALLYAEFSARQHGYASALRVGEVELAKRVGYLAVAANHGALDQLAERLAEMYDQLASAVGPKHPPEGLRLDTLASTARRAARSLQH